MILKPADNSTRQTTASRWRKWSLCAALALSASACSTGNQGLKFAEQQNPKFAEANVTPSELPPGRLAHPGPSRAINQRSSKSGAIQQMGYEAAGPEMLPTPRDIQPAAMNQPPFRIQFSAAEERRPVSKYDTSADDSRSALASQYPDEYLFDGGDRGFPVHFDSQGQAGVETEDTLAEFTDDAGKRRVKITNRVAIYSPRFANVTTISHASEDTTVRHLASDTGLVRTGGMRNQVVPSAESQHSQLQSLVERARGSQLQQRETAHDTQQEVRLVANIHTVYPANVQHFVGTGELLNSEEARLAESLQWAQNWTRKQNPEVVAKLESAGDIKSHFRDTELVGLKENPLSAGKLRIVKLADKHVAESGDVVTFTIRFDNQGHRELSDIVIVDNLTPRLQYVHDSATSDRAGRLVTQENGEGSLILRWELDEPLPGRVGGVVTFKARVK